MVPAADFDTSGLSSEWLCDRADRRRPHHSNLREICPPRFVLLSVAHRLAIAATLRAR